MTKITLESRGISVSIHNSNQGEDNIESIGFAFLGKIAEEALNKINNKRKLNKLVSDDFDCSEKEDDGYDEEEEYEEEDDEEYEEEEDEEEDEDEDEDEEEDEDEDEDEEGEEDFENTKKSNKKFPSKPSQCLKYIKNNNKDELIKLVNNSSGKIRIRGTTKDQRNWVYQTFSEIDNVNTWSWYSKNGRILVIDIYSQKN